MRVRKSPGTATGKASSARSLSGLRSSVARARTAAELRGVDLGPVFPLLTFVFVVAAIEIAAPTYLRATSIQASLTTAAPIILLAIGGSLVVLAGGLDLSIGGLVALSAVVFARAAPQLGWVVAAIVVLVGGFLGGALLGWLQSWAQIPSFITTLGALGVYSGLASWLSKQTPIPINDGLSLMNWLIGTTGGVPNTIIVTATALVVLVAVVRWTRRGLATIAVGASEASARLAGIRSTRVRMLVFGCSATTAVLAGFCLTAPSASADATFGTGLLLPTITAIVVGGTAISGGNGGLGRAVIGALIVGSVTSGMVVTGANPGLQQVLFGVATIIAVALSTNRRALGVVK